MKRGRKRGEFCAGSYGEVHQLTDETRRWKVYVSKRDGLPRVLSNGCALCNAMGNKMRECGVSA